MSFPTPRLRRFLWAYKALWTFGLPLILGYLFHRARRDPDYRKHLRERFGFHPSPLPGAVWIHAVSLGELRSAVPIIRRLLADGQTVVTTHLTPAGRREAHAIFADDIAANRLRSVWVPFEFRWAFTRFFKAYKPPYGLIMEIEIWPELIVASRAKAVPIFACNAQYPLKSFERDAQKSKWRRDLHQGLSGAFVKSDLQKQRFAAAGCPNIHVTGELRFDQPIPQDHIAKGRAAKSQLDRPTVTITSVVKGEDDTYIAAIKATRGPSAPLFVYVPRAPERFEETYDLLTAAGLTVARRSDIIKDDLTLKRPAVVDIILGDSFGEMYFYLALCDAAIIGGSFVEKGAHNISEPLALGKPVVTGPHTWTIEFPMTEALSANAATQVPTQEALIDLLKTKNYPSAHAAKTFFATQQGAVDRTMAAIKLETQPPE